MNTFDFETLRQRGMESIPRLAKDQWTDYNASDPGITLLEQFCFALTDLGYRIDFDMADHLAAGGEAAYSVLYSPRQILPSDPVSFFDFRRVFIDTDNVRNASVKPAEEIQLVYAPFSDEILLARDRDPLLAEGLYESIELAGLWSAQLESAPAGEAVDPAALEAEAKAKAQSLRSLCTDFSKVVVLDRQNIAVQVGIELGGNSDPEVLLPKVWEILDQYISPVLPFHDLAGFLGAEGDETLNTAFEGPALAQGFLSREDVLQFQRRTELRRSDMIRELTRLAPMVKAVRELDLDIDDVSLKSWIVSLDPNRAPFFHLDNTSVRFFRGDLEVTIDPERISTLREDYRDARLQRLQSNFPAAALDRAPRRGIDRKTGKYTSIRYHMPALYGVGPSGLPPEATLSQQAGTRQLSGYLLFFEQVMANKFAQLAHSWKLFSVARADTDENTDTQSYFTEALSDLPAMEGILKETAPSVLQEKVQDNVEPDGAPASVSRTHRFLDHLLARFSESMQDYTFLMNGLDTGAFPEASPEAVIRDKRTFLREYAGISRKRGTAFNYTLPGWDTENIAGVTRKILRLLGLDEATRRDLSAREEGLYMLEHILLRPRPGDTFQHGPLLFEASEKDPYSNQISFFLANNGRFYQGADDTEPNPVQKYAGRLIRAEVPAHIRINLFWLSYDRLSEWALGLRAFLDTLNNSPMYMDVDAEDHQFPLRVARDRLLDLIAAMSTSDVPGIPYPLTDLPLSPTVKAVQSDPDTDPDLWGARIYIPYAQVGVLYVLTDRNRNPIVIDGERIEKRGDVPDGIDAQGRPYIYLDTPGNLTEAQTYNIRAEKEVTLFAGTDDENTVLKYVYLQQTVRVRIGIAPADISLTDPEINYGTTTTLLLNETQAGVDYRLYTLDAAGNQVRLGTGEVSGDPDEEIPFITPVLYEDTEIYVCGSRDNFTVSELVGVAPIVRVRPNPDLVPANTILTAHFNDEVALSDIRIAKELSPVPGTNNYVQASVTYTLYRLDIPDPLFVHQKDPARQPADALEIDPGHGIVARIELPTVTEYETLAANATRIATATVATDGAALDFGSGDDITLQEDIFFVVVASKPGHDEPVILHDPANARLHMAATLVYPDPGPSVTINPTPVPSGTRGTVEVGGITSREPQQGVLYFLRITDTDPVADQRKVFFHDQTTDSVRKDGVETSKVGVDFVVGAPYELPLLLRTDEALTASVQVDVVAQKVQTGMEVVLTDGTDITLPV